MVRATICKCTQSLCLFVHKSLDYVCVLVLASGHVCIECCHFGCREINILNQQCIHSLSIPTCRSCFPRNVGDQYGMVQVGNWHIHYVHAYMSVYMYVCTLMYMYLTFVCINVCNVCIQYISMHYVAFDDVFYWIRIMQPLICRPGHSLSLLSVAAIMTWLVTSTHVIRSLQSSFAFFTQFAFTGC